MSFSVEGWLLNAAIHVNPNRHEERREAAGGITNPDGSPATYEQAVKMAIEELLKGHRVIPMGGPCEGFDHSGSGCPGHEED